MTSRNLSDKLSVRNLSHILRPQVGGTWTQEFGGTQPTPSPVPPMHLPHWWGMGVQWAGALFRRKAPPQCPPANPSGRRAAVRPLPNAGGDPRRPSEGEPQRQQQSPHPWPSTLAFETSAATQWHSYLELGQLARMGRKPFPGGLDNRLQHSYHRSPS